MICPFGLIYTVVSPGFVVRYTKILYTQQRNISVVASQNTGISIVCSTNQANSKETTKLHFNDVIMSAVASRITSLTIVYSTVYSGADQRKHQSSASLVFVRGIHRRPVNSPHKGPVTRKFFPSDDVIMSNQRLFVRGIHRWYRKHFHAMNSKKHPYVPRTP